MIPEQSQESSPFGITLLAQQAGIIHVQLSASSRPDRSGLPDLRQLLTTLFRTPIRLGVIPAVAGLLSVKVSKEGGLTLYFRPDVAGRFAAQAAQQLLDGLLPTAGRSA